MSVTEDISAAREKQLDEVLADYLNAAQEGRAPSRKTLLERYPELATELDDFFADQDHVERLAAPLRALAPPPLLAGVVLGDYELIDEIAQGGMGIVYRACQKSLQRLVAVKVLLAGPLASPEQWRRFQAEAEAIASLDHPHIVPVYEVGVSDQRPYFSMKLLEGGSLADQLRRTDRPDPREAAALLATIADAVHYAHERGILHRDLKPANILLDAQGQPHVSDFGLAKRAAPTAETPVPHAALTVSGAIVGTPSYMAPEQAAGSRGITTATDVYGLGAILYELLAGRPPFQGDDLFDTLRRLQEEEPAAPRALNPRLDRDIETICLKCLQKEPPRRYASARELALDLRRYLAGEAIEARPIGRLERVWRWCRRKPIAAAVTLAFVAVIVAAFVLVDQARRAALASADRETNAKDNAAASRDKGRRVIDDFCLRLSTDGWGEDPAVQEKRKQLLEKGLAYYRDFLDDPEADAPARGELIHTWFRLGDIYAALDNPDTALDAFHSARVAAETLLQFEPTNLAVRTDLARVHNRIGMLHKRANRTEDALKSYHAAHDLLTTLRRQAPDDTAILGELGVSCNNLGNLHFHLGQLEPARAFYGESIDLNRDLMRRSSDSQNPYALAVSLDNYARVISGPGQRGEAWRCLDEANQLLRRIVADEPQVPRYRQELGRNLYNRGDKQRGEKRSADAVQSLREGRDVLTRLVEMQPRIGWYQEDLARLLQLLGHAYKDLGDKDKGQLIKAIDAYRSAAEICQKGTAKNPRSSEFVYRRACCLFDMALLLTQRHQQDEMMRAYREARDLDRRLVQAAPNNLDYRKALGMTLNNLGRALSSLKRHDEALAALREALEHNRFAFERTRNVSFHRRILNTTYVFLGDVYRDTNRRADWIALLRERRALWPENTNELFAIACDLARAKDDDEAMRTLEQAVHKGYKDVGRLAKEPALTSLRQRPDFAALLQRSKASN